MTSLRRRDLLRWGGLAALAACTPTGAPTARSDSPPGTASPTSSGATPPSPTPTAATTPNPGSTLSLVCRDAWGARAPRPAARHHTVQQLTVHHSATAATGTGQGPGHLRAYQAFHMDERAWSDIAYHVAVDRDGVAYQLRDLQAVGETGTSYDPAGHFLLLLDGNFDEHDVSRAQLDGAARVLAWAAGHFGVDLASTAAHRDHARTACPGDALYDRLPELVDAAAAVRTAGPVRLAPRCGPEAAAAVESLEATGTVAALLT